MLEVLKIHIGKEEPDGSVKLFSFHGEEPHNFVDDAHMALLATKQYDQNILQVEAVQNGRNFSITFKKQE